MNLFNTDEKQKKKAILEKRQEINMARAGINEAIHRFADLSAAFHRGELVGGQANGEGLQMCAHIVNLLHEANGTGHELESRFAPEEKEKKPFRLLKRPDKEPEVFDACPE